MKVVFIGMCGHSLKAYAVLKKREDAVLCGVAPGSAQEGMTKSFDPEIPFFEDWKEMLDKTRPSLAIISPIFGLTGECVVECASRGIDVFCEKPIAGTLEELQRVERAVKENEIHFGAMHYLRVSPAFWQGAAMVRRGDVGEVRLLNAQKSYRFGKRPEWYSNRSLFTGIIPWVGIHAIDWVYAFSEKRFLSVDAECFGVPERAALCRFSLEDGVMASVSLDYYRPETAPTHDDDRIRCVGTKGIIEVRDGKIYLMNDDGERVIDPEPAPELFESFLDGRDIIDRDDIFYLTRVALISRDAADQKSKLQIEV